MSRTPAEILRDARTIAVVGASLAEVDEQIDLVDVFRRPEHCADVAREAAAAGAKALWLQLGIVSPEARIIARQSGMDYVENACTLVVHRNEIA